MSISALFQRLVPLDGLKETVHRFPAAVICSATAFILAVLLNHEIIKENDEIWSRVMALLACGYLWFGAVKLMLLSVATLRQSLIYLST